MAAFNVLNEPWIPVITVKGDHTDLSLRDTLVNAHELTEVCCENPLETYALQRFLIAFLMDAYRLPHAGDRKKLYLSGKFDPAVIDGYIDLCKSEGVTFDLFDKERPFYQAAYNENYDSDKKKSIAIIFHAVPSGQNHLHFDHKPMKKCYPAQAFRALLSAQMFATAMAQGYPSSVNDTPCWYTLLKGHSLFETFCLSMLSVGECRGIDFDAALPAWRDVCVEIPKAEHADVSMLEGLTFRPRRITLIPDRNGMISELYYQQGQSFHPNGKWADPHVTYSVNKDGEYVSIKPKTGRTPWRDVGLYASSKEDKYSKPAGIIRLSDNLLNRDTPRIIMLFGLVSDNAKYLDWQFDTLSVPGEILFDPEKADSLRSALQKTEQAAKCVYDTVNQVANAAEHTKDAKKKSTAAANEAQAKFFAVMHSVVFTNYMSALAKADVRSRDWEEKPNEIIKVKIKSAAAGIVGEYVQKLGNTARYLEKQTQMIKDFHKDLNSIFKERKVTE